MTTYTLTNWGGYWRIRYTDSQGNVKRRSVGSVDKVTKREATRRRQAMIARHEHQAQEKDEQKDRTLRELVDRFLADLEPDVQRNTMSAYRVSTMHLLEFMSRDNPGVLASEITPSDVTDFRRDMSDRGYAKSTIALTMRCSHQVFLFGVREKVIDESPFTGAPKNPPMYDRTGERDVPEEDVIRVMRQNPNMRAVIAMCYYAGLRTGEASAVTADDLQWNTNVGNLIIIRGGKTGAREVPMTKELSEILETGLPGCGRGVESLGNSLQKACAMADVTPFTFRDLRRTRSNIWLRKLGPMRESYLLGHSPVTARRSYFRINEDDYALITGVDE